MNRNKNSNLEYSFLVIDIMCLILSFIVAYYLRHHNLSLFKYDVYTKTFFMIIVIDIFLFMASNPYDNVIYRGKLIELIETLKYIVVSFLVCITYLFIVKSSNDFSRLTMAYTYSMYFVISYLSRLCWKSIMYRKAKSAIINGNKSLLIICYEKDLVKIIESISENNFEFYRISGICVCDKDYKKKKFNNYKIVANLDNLLEYVSKNWIDDIFIATDYHKIPNKIMHGLISTCIPLHVKYDGIELFENRPQTISKLGSINVITSVNKEYKQIEVIAKRLMDIFGALVGCVITVLLTFVIGPLIYIKSPGNIFYVSNRVGKNGKIFKFYKFRSMTNNADELKKDLEKYNRLKDGMMFKIENDPRIIPGIGSFIRKTSIDEFPQFFNVLRGDMSLVGTRPPTLDEWNKYSPYYRSRLSIKPGITGLWQTSGRSEIIDFDEVVKLDNEYINNWSLMLDIKLLFKTVVQVLKREGSM